MTFDTFDRPFFLLFMATLAIVMKGFVEAELLFFFAGFPQVFAGFSVDQNEADNLSRYVENGGTLLTTARSGVKDEANAVVDMPLPGLLADVCGVEVDEYEALPPDTKVPLKLELPGPIPKTPAAQAWLWCDVLTPTTAQVVARYQASVDEPGLYYAGRAAITLNRCGQGQAIYVGTLGDETLHDTVVGWLLDAASLLPTLTTPPGVEAVERWKNGQRLLFLLNHADQAHDVVLPQPSRDLLTGQLVNPQATLEPKGVMILREIRSDDTRYMKITNIESKRGEC